MAGEPAAPVLDQIAIARRAATPRAEAAGPGALGQHASGFEIALQGRPESRRAEERAQMGGEPEALLENNGRIAVRARQEGAGPELAAIPGFGKALEGFGGVGTVGGQALHHGPD